MSVMITGMEMPTNCGECPFFIENRHDRGDDSLCRASGKEAKCGCPLIPVPPHGRLIDADALMELYADTDDLRLKDMKVPIAVIRQNIMDMPAIIPAEEGEQ